MEAVGFRNIDNMFHKFKRSWRQTVWNCTAHFKVDVFFTFVFKLLFFLRFFILVNNIELLQLIEEFKLFIVFKEFKIFQTLLRNLKSYEN